MNWLKANNLSEIDFSAQTIIVYAKYQPECTEALTALLNEAERLHYSKFRYKAALQCRALLRLLLSQYLKVSPHDLYIRTTTKGKPFVANYPIFFNVSHTQSAYIIAISKIGRIGVDIEQLVGNEDIEAMADYAFSVYEKQKVFSSTSEPKEFEKIWTLKEALLKALGVGLVPNLHQLDANEKLKNYNLKNITFSCPEGETASIVATELTKLKAFAFDIISLSILQNT